MRTDAEIKNAIGRYADTVKRIAYMYLHNTHDMEDIFQTVFLKYALYLPVFQTAGHEKAWIIRISINCCKDYLKSAWKRKVELPGAQTDVAQAVPAEYQDLLQAVRELEPKYRDVIYLHYYEGYQASEIAKIIGKRDGTVYSILARAREQLKRKLGGEYGGS